jgi:hypothetical protein
MTKRFNEAVSHSSNEGHCHTWCAPSRGPSVRPGSAYLMAQPIKLIGARQFSLVKRMAFREPRPTNP